VAAVFFVFYGVTTFMSQIESVVFLTRLPPGMVPRLFLMGALIAAPFSLLAVLILGKRKAATVDIENNSRLVMATSEWAWKLAIIAVAYVILYFTFGYYIAWRNPAVPEYYGGTDPGSFFLPNRYMPEPVRMAHLVETASSNFIFGVLIGWLLTERHAPLRQAWDAHSLSPGV
jgi:hypothetical protein